jgi:hypothetical protein
MSFAEFLLIKARRAAKLLSDVKAALLQSAGVTQEASCYILYFVALIPLLANSRLSKTLELLIARLIPEV